VVLQRDRYAEPWAELEAFYDTLYGTTCSGGSQDLGTVFRIGCFPDPMISVLSLDDTANSCPVSGLTLSHDGYLYGATPARKVFPDSFGSIFKVVPGMFGVGSLEPLVRFANDESSGCLGPPGLPGGRPNGLVLAKATSGDMYGTTHVGGGDGFGTLFALPSGQCPASLVQFEEEHSHPYAALVEASDGQIYGSTSGLENAPDVDQGHLNDGTLFRFDPELGYEELHDFGLATASGSYPLSALVELAPGDLAGQLTDPDSARKRTVPLRRWGWGGSAAIWVAAIVTFSVLRRADAGTTLTSCPW
jgi:hypothetical protein